jgi:hypothetical protein
MFCDEEMSRELHAGLPNVSLAKFALQSQADRPIVDRM